MNSKVTRSLSFLTAILMFILILPFGAFALDAEDTGIWDGSIAQGYAGGTGAQDDPYQISNGSELAFLAQQVNSRKAEAGACYKLTADIVLNDTANWENWNDTTAPENGWQCIGLQWAKFSGIFDGDNHKISGIYVNTDENTGLFGYADKATIKNLSIEKSYFHAGYTVGSVVGWMNDDVTVRNCSNSGTVSVSGDRAGGIVGMGHIGKIINCHNSGKIIGDYESSYQIGGIIGFGLKCSAISCTNAGEIAGRGNVGGIGGDLKSITYCHNSGKISGCADESGQIGGIVGWCANGWNITDCYNSGEVSGNSNVGGIAGVDIGTVTNCYNVGSVSGNDCIGGVIGGISFNSPSGYEYVGIIENCYYLDTSCNNSLEFGEALSDEQMKEAGSYNGFDFELIWTMEGDGSYPYPELNPRFRISFADGITGKLLETSYIVQEGAILSRENFPTPPKHEGRDFIDWNYNGKPIYKHTVITARYNDPNGTPFHGYILNEPDAALNVWGDFTDYYPEMVTDREQKPMIYAAAFAGGKVYGFLHEKDDSRFYIMDAETREITYPGYDSKLNVIAMAYDHKNGAMYAIAETESGNLLYKVNLAIGSLECIGNAIDTVTLAIDGNGNAYGISHANNGASLWKINLNSAKRTLIGNTGVKSQHEQSMVWDLNPGNCSGRSILTMRTTVCIS